MITFFLIIENYRHNAENVKTMKYKGEKNHMCPGWGSNL